MIGTDTADQAGPGHQFLRNDSKKKKREKWKMTFKRKYLQEYHYGRRGVRRSRSSEGTMTIRLKPIEFQRLINHLEIKLPSGTKETCARSSVRLARVAGTDTRAVTWRWPAKTWGSWNQERERTALCKPSWIFIGGRRKSNKQRKIEKLSLALWKKK